MKKYLSGLSLIELSIVLVVIGLLVGAVFYGQRVQEKGESGVALTEASSHLESLEAFREKYKYLPGDMPADVAERYFTGGAVVNGNGNGRWDCPTECDAAFLQMQQAGLSPSLAGITNTSSASKIKGASWVPVDRFSVTPPGGGAPLEFRDVLRIGGSDGSNLLSGGALPVSMLEYIDSRIDDGKPLSGRFVVGDAACVGTTISRYNSDKGIKCTGNILVNSDGSDAVVGDSIDPPDENCPAAVECCEDADCQPDDDICINDGEPDAYCTCNSGTCNDGGDCISPEVCTGGDGAGCDGVCEIPCIPACTGCQACNGGSCEPACAANECSPSGCCDDPIDCFLDGDCGVYETCRNDGECTAFCECIFGKCNTNQDCFDNFGPDWTCEGGSGDDCDGSCVPDSGCPGGCSCTSHTDCTNGGSWYYIGNDRWQGAWCRSGECQVQVWDTNVNGIVSCSVDPCCTIACFSDGDCGGGVTHFCSNAGTCGAFCQQICSAACNSDADCSGEEVCTNPGSCNATCGDPEGPPPDLPSCWPAGGSPCNPYLATTGGGTFNWFVPCCEPDLYCFHAGTEDSGYCVPRAPEENCAVAGEPCRLRSCCAGLTEVWDNRGGIPGTCVCE